MANTLKLKRRIKTAQNVSKTTKAMQLIATSKLKRAQDAALSSRPYVEKLIELSKKLSLRATETFTHPYMSQSDNQDKTLLIVLSPDKGLCGGLVTNLLKEYMHFFPDENLITVTLGKKIERSASQSKNEHVAAFPFGNTLPRFVSVFPLLKIIEEYYLTKKVKSVKILYSKFLNFFSQIPTVTTVLPIVLPKETEKTNTISQQNEYQLFEPQLEKMLPALLKHYLEMVIYQFLLENFLSEQAARMIAMQNATDNARDIISALTLEYNKARQEKITSEILDITSGATLQ